MENVQTRGIYFNEQDIKGIVDKYLSWTDMVDDQILCAQGVMSSNTPIGTAVIVGVDGIKCDAGSDVIRLVMASGSYELQIKTTHENDELNIHFDHTIPVRGTYGCLVDGVLDILTDEEKEFKRFVDEALGGRDDEYANAFRKDNVRSVGGRGLILLEKMKAEVQNDDILVANGVTPIQLVAVFIEKTESYLEACKNVEELTAKHDEIFAQYQETFVEGGKLTKKIARNIEIVNKKIEANRKVADFCLATINAAVLPVLNAEIEC